MTNKEIITTFYSAFTKGDYQQMAACYHEDILFEDPAFGQLAGQKAIKMWEMLLSNKAAAPEVSFSNIQVDHETGSADWKATYFYGPKKRKVLNEVHATFTFKDGKIIEHTDNFDIWKWSSQALGPLGYFLGWTPFMKGKIQQLANKRLDDFMKK